ncbi:MAG TPA: hypothetical protein VF043_14350 [Ktedonobacteraceae bacterium]
MAGEGRKPPPRATIKALPTHPFPARPYGPPGPLPHFLAQVDAWWVTTRAAPTIHGPGGLLRVW